MRLCFVRPGATVLLVSVCALAGCSLSGKPPLPKHASIERLGKPAGTDFAAVVENADVIYFPTNRAASGSKSEPAALLLEALEKSGRPYAVAWDLIEVPQQPLLDELEARPIAQRDNLIAKISISGNGRTQEHCRSVLRAGTSHQLALAPPNALLARIAADRSLVAADVPELPRGFILPSDGWENYAERHATMNNREMAESFRTQTVRQQFAAERIVEFFHRQSGENKLLVFGNEGDLEAGHGIPFYVAQKLNVRQLVIGPDTPAPAKAKLLTRRAGAGGGLKIVDRTPIAAGD